jgi:hypothetical protein
MKLLPPEILETRIAPATFLVSGTSLEVTDSAGLPAQDLPSELAAQVEADSDYAVLLQTGDKLVFDSNGNGEVDSSDAQLVNITAGQAMVFLTDFDGDVAFEQSEISGLAVSNAFSGVIKTDVAGSIVTALDAAGLFTSTGGLITLQQSSIAKLEISGAVYGDIIAGGDITNLKVGKAIYNSSVAQSVDRLLTSEAADGENTTLGNATLDLDYKGAIPNAGNLENVTLDHGARQIITGDGDLDGTGGSITNLNILDQFGGLTIQTGDGGIAAKGIGGDGGSISKVKIASKYVDGGISITAGSGGDGADIAAAGHGGSITDLSITGVVIDGAVQVTSGGGGDGGLPGGNGGEITNVKIVAKHSILGNVQVTAGDAGVGFGANAGGIGGAITKITLQAPQVDGIFSVSGGDGGQGNVGGIGGEVSSVTATITNQIDGFNITGGRGGNGLAGSGGDGGEVTNLTLKTGINYGNASAVGGRGGDANMAIGIAGDGGSVSKVKISSSIRQAGFASLTGGVGGNGLTGASGGIGGSVSDSSIAGAQIDGDLTVRAGNGGQNGGPIPTEPPSKGEILAGSGGSVTNVKLSAKHSIDGAVSMIGGIGGSSTGSNRGGDGGSVTKSSITSPSVGNVNITAGGGGDGAEGGNGGLVTSVNANISGRAGTFNVDGGSGGDATAGFGGIGGEVKSVVLKAQTHGGGTVDGGDGGRRGGNRQSGRSWWKSFEGPDVSKLPHQWECHSHCRGWWNWG